MKRHEGVEEGGTGDAFSSHVKLTDFILVYAGFAVVAAILTFGVILMAAAFRHYDHRIA